MVSMINSQGGLLSAALNVEGLISRAGSAVAARARVYYQQPWRFRLEHLSQDEAVIRVQGSETYHVEFFLEDRGKVLALCDCPYADEEPRVICKHKVAAGLYLRDYLKRSVPSETWESVLTKAVRSSRSAQETAGKLLFFSLQQRGASWAVVPYTVAAGFFPAEAWRDAAEVQRLVSEHGLSSQAEKIEPYATNGGARSYLNVTRAQSALVKMLASSGMYYGNYYPSGSALDFDALFSVLEGGPLYAGTDKNPLKQALTVVPEAARIEMEMETLSDGIRLRALGVAGEQTFPLRARETKIISHYPLWVLSGQSVLRVDEPHELFATFQESAEWKVPTDAESVFLEKHLTPLAERFRLRGEEVRWEDLENAACVPRLYLSEAEAELHVQLRFGYGDYEVPYERQTPPQSVRRHAETRALVRVRRQGERESAAAEALGTAAYALKRTATPGQFVLRSKVHPFDFLLRYVPQLTAAGYEIYGEDDLTLARVNRHRPTISFGVTSGIDWFDVRATVNFGEIEVSLAEIRRTLRRRERFVKLADGTVGEIPPEWLERYRHLFALGEETEKGLRVAHHHLTMLDQLLADDERTSTDKEFKRRRETLRNFDGIKPQKLPRHSTLR